jgi:hypothetical protein
VVSDREAQRARTGRAQRSEGRATGGSRYQGTLTRDFSAASFSSQMGRRRILDTDDQLAELSQRPAQGFAKP